MIPLRSWKYAIPILGSVAALIFFGLWRVEVAKAKSLKIEMQALEDWVEEYQAEISQCNSDKAITEKVSNDYQRSIAALRRERDRLRGQPGCVLPKPSGASSPPTDTGNQLSGGNGIRVDWLYDFAGRAEQDRLTGAACVNFIDQLYKSRGYND